MAIAIPLLLNSNDQAKADWIMKLFYTGPVVNTEMLVVMLDKHGIVATQEFVEPLPDDGDLNRLAKVLVSEVEYDRARKLFYAEREDEL